MESLYESETSKIYLALAVYTINFAQEKYVKSFLLYETA
jgi:hypothetical protein